MTNFSSLNTEYFEKFGNFPDLLPLINNLGEEKAAKRLEKAIQTGEPIDFPKEFNVSEGDLY